MRQYELFSSSELETIKFAQLLANVSRLACNIYLWGDVGLGKTSFCRGFLRGLGYFGRVKSPSYSLVESYILTSLTVYHIDFYRLSNLEELEHIGVRDYFNSHALCLVEWPNLVANSLPKEDISIHLKYHGSFFVRKIVCRYFSNLGKSILEEIFIDGNIRIC